MTNELSEKDKKAFALIRNRIAHYGKSPSLREINEVTGGKSPRSASLVVKRLVEAGLIKKKGPDLILVNTQPLNLGNTVNVPLIGAVSCGSPMLAEENIEAYIPVASELARKGSKYFLLRAVGDSMNEAGITSGDLLLVRQQETANNGQIVVALINDEATVKIFERTNNAIILRPRLNNRIHQPIILTNNFMIQGLVVLTLPADLY